VTLDAAHPGRGLASINGILGRGRDLFDEDEPLARIFEVRSSDGGRIGWFTLDLVRFRAAERGEQVLLIGQGNTLVGIEVDA
jgi:hypothetical protein